MDFEADWIGTLTLPEEDHRMLLTILTAAQHEDLKTLQLYKRDIVEFVTKLSDY